jgi:hypothetical protein
MYTADLTAVKTFDVLVGPAFKPVEGQPKYVVPEQFITLRLNEILNVGTDHGVYRTCASG